MKKILSVTLVLVLISAASFAQRGPGDDIRKKGPGNGFSNGQITRGERFELRKDAVRYNAVKHHARKDGKITPRERRRMHKMRKHNRHDAFRFKHNRHHQHSGYHRGR